MLFNSWLDSLRRVSSINRRSCERVTRRAGRLGCAAEFLEDRVMLSSSSPDLAKIIAAEMKTIADRLALLEAARPLGDLEGLGDPGA